ncbi:MAG: DEAD/DEAH box helicase [Acidobacteria bacterium]|nr:DEAD/DEAH box helicase [Acidobacteriota bacterium]
MRPLHGFHPITAAWFGGRFAGATTAQLEAWPRIRDGGDVLISAPTGSGKTLAAFLICIDRLVARSARDALADRTSVVYVSPLKALSSDIQRNLDGPLGEIAELAAAGGEPVQEVRTAVRTGDTPTRDREQMVRRPPHILVTTPESLFILLTAERSRRMLSTTETVIVDEIHALIDDKRGSPLALPLARLDRLVAENEGAKPQRIGLSATVKPIEEVARFLTGAPAEDPPAAPRPLPARGRVWPPASIVDSGHRRALDLAVEVPQEELGVVATNEMWGEIYDRIAELALAHRTTIVFVNTRRLAERVAHHLAERLGADAVLAHHGSLSRQLRQTAELELKEGRLRVVVATASLELGIDVGSVELVCQVGTPRSIAVALQRVGRSGHKVDPSFVPKGRFFATTRDELVECAAIVRAIRRGVLDERRMRPWPRDVLAQQIVAAAATGPWREDDLFALVRTATPYRDLPRAEFDALVAMLSDGIASPRGRHGTWLHRDRVNGVLRGRRGARLAAITSGGAIPDNANYLVVAEPEGTTVGTVDEDFAVESMAGDIFLLGTTSWRIRRVEAGRVRVEDARGAAPSVPFWLGEAPGRTRELSDEISELRERVAAPDGAPRDGADPVAFVARECGVDRSGAEQLVAYVRAGVAALGAVPSRRTVVAERFFDEGGGMQLVLHAPLGARINRAWGLALRKRFCRSFNVELQAAATDNGIVISLAEQHSFPLEIVFRFLHPETLVDVLTQAMLPAPMFGARWRWNAARALAVLRFAGGRKVPPPILRMRTEDLLAAVFPDQVACQENLSGEIRIPDHPLVDETIRDCLHEAMDVDGLRALVVGFEQGTVATRAIDTAEPSPFGHEILNANPYAFLDDAPLEERRARAVQLRRTLGTDGGEIGALDEAAIAEVAQEVWPVVRDPEELHDALLTLGLVPPRPEWEPWLGPLAATRRATRLHAASGAATFWVATERTRLALAIHAGGRLTPPVPDVEQAAPESVGTAVTDVLRGWLDSSGPLRASALAETLGVPLPQVEAGLTRLEGEGQVLRGRFTAAGRADGAEIEWCNRRVLARIHRLTLGRLRREIEPVSSADLVRFLARWQHLAAGTRQHGTAGLLQIVRQLQGCEVSAAAWERDVLAARLEGYEPEMLDQLCLSGEVMWGRLSPHPAFAGAAGEPDASRTPARRRRVRPTRVAPVALFLRQDLEWLVDAGYEGGGARSGPACVLSHPAEAVLDALHGRGASFLRDLVQQTGRLASEVEDGLWELVAAGLVTADGFDNLRALIDPRRRRGEGRFRAARPRHAAGRWALLAPSSGASQSSPEAVGSAPAAGSAAADGARRRARADAFARQLLLRWGVVFRDLVRRESLMPPWRDVLEALRRMEACGDVRGGRFVAGFVGEQFARPDAVELLRIVRREGCSGPAVRVAAADPLNLAGIVTPGARISALSGETVELLPPSTASEQAAVAEVAAAASG